jgi:uncharacterized protein
MSELNELKALRVALRDGVELVADAYVGASATARPAILELTPYGRGRDRQNFSSEAAYWVRHGYAFVIVDCRGTGDSGGDFCFFVGDGEDGYDVVEWIARQPWCNGRVGMRGASYTGTNQWHTARLRPPSLKAIVPNATGNGSDDVVYNGGTFHLSWALSWPSNLGGSTLPQAPSPDWDAVLAHRPLRSADSVALGQPSPLFQELLAHPPSDRAYWQRFEFSTEDYAGIDIPVLAFSGWFDGTLRGTLQHDSDMRLHSPARRHTHLIIGPWEHITCSDGGYSYIDAKPADRIGQTTLPPQAFLPGLAITRQFYDAHLKGEGQFEQPPVQLYITGSERWVTAEAWPPAQVKERVLYLHSGGHAHGLQGDGRLDATRPGQEPPDLYTYDPARPAPFVPPGGAPPLPMLAPLPCLRDLQPLLLRDDVVVYCSDLLTQALTVLGNVTLVLHFASDAPDSDFVFRLEDVAPDGRGRCLGSRNAGMAQARWREGYEREVLLQPGVPAVLTLKLGGIGHTFLVGHQLRLSITSSAFPRLPANPNTGLPIADDTSPPRKARQQVLHDAVHASHLVLPCLD